MNNVVEMRQPETATFDDFWTAFPRRIGKPLARAKWDAITSEKGLQTRILDRDSGLYIAINLNATPAEIIAGAKRYAKSQRDPQTYKLKDDGKYTCHPATWLNQGRWEDD